MSSTVFILRRNVSACVLGLSVLLAGCLGRTETTAYAIDGPPAMYADDPAMVAYLEKTMKDRLAAPLMETDDPEERARLETAREFALRVDLVKALHAMGYYSGEVVYNDDTDAPLTGTYRVEPGTLYTIAAVVVDPPEFDALLNRKAIHDGAPLRAVDALAVQAELQKTVEKGKCYFTLSVTNEVALNQTDDTAVLTYKVQAGPEAVFGPVSFVGMTTVKESYLNKLVPWKEGGCYTPEQIERLKTRLMETNLFARAETVLPDAPDAQGRVPVEIRLSERAQRTVRAGASYYTDEGPGVLLGWEHRNIWGAAERLKTTLRVSEKKQSIDTEIFKPFFLRHDQVLNVRNSLHHLDTDAYDELGGSLRASISRSFSRYLTGETGAEVALRQIKEKNDRQHEKKLYGLVSLPNSLTFDNRNNPLNPTRGWRLFGTATPFFDVLGESDPFVKAEGEVSTYLSLDSRDWYVLALRAQMGSIMGAGTFKIPPSERFFAGGGGSVRGYGFQEVGPKDSDGDPVGGRAMVTASTEMRFRFTESIGAVAFVDAGTVSEHAMPEFKKLSVGAGVGARYYTGFGPIRFDVAVPLTEKKDIKSNYQIYISIGQAF